jgi:hypothetical protein
MSVDDQYKKMKEPFPDSFPPFEEESWKKMELLLDKHLPQRPGKPFPYIAVFSCLILISLTTFLPAKQPHESAKNSAIVHSNEDSSKKRFIQKETVEEPFLGSNPKNSRSTSGQTQFVLNEKELSNSITAFLLNRKQNEISHSDSNPVAINSQHPTDSKEVSINYTGLPALRTNQNDFLLNTKEPANSTSLIAETKSVARKKSVKSQFSLTFSTGLEAPGTGLNHWGKPTPLIGIGIQYNLGNKLVLRTGISTATKIYTARDKDYNPSAGGWTNYYVFDKIDADCKIIEIPLSVGYRIANGKQGSVYFSAGSSSYIMRKEAYSYSYKNQYGNDTVVTRAFSNNSRHLFSSVNLSVIAEKKINNRLSFIAEPIVKIPTQGIGVGNIRLFNAGIVVSARFKLR